MILKSITHRDEAEIEAEPDIDAELDIDAEPEETHFGTDSSTLVIRHMPGWTTRTSNYQNK